MKKSIVFVFVLICISCVHTLKGHRGVSNTVEESQKRNVFICKLYALSDSYPINDSLKIEIKSAWLEKRWAYGNESSETIELEEYQIIIETNETDICNFPKLWQIGNSFKESFRRCGKQSIMIDIPSLPKNQKMEWKVTSGKRRYDDSKIIGKFQLFIN